MSREASHTLHVHESDFLSWFVSEEFRHVFVPFVALKRPKHPRDEELSSKLKRLEGTSKGLEKELLSNGSQRIDLTQVTLLYLTCRSFVSIQTSFVLQAKQG